MVHYSTLLPLLLGSASAWLPQERELAAFNQTARFEQLGKRFKPNLASGITKIRGVNFGGWLVGEKWMQEKEWANVLQCGNSPSEFDCMADHYKGSNRETGNKRFEEHWRTWINPDTVQSVHDVGLNTIRIPIGYWSYVDIVDKASEPFADGNRMLPYLDAVVKKAADLGIYVIIDLHGAPGGQQEDVFTGQNNKPAGFFNDYNFGRAQKWLAWMTDRIHNNPAYSTVGMIDVPNDKKLHVQFMSSKWDSGNPRSVSAVANDGLTAFDDHNYIGFALQGTQRGDAYSLMHSACTDHRTVSGQDFTFTGEWSMTSDYDWHDKEFFNKFFTAQQQLYEEPGMAGWVYWTWKTETDDPRWTYSYATYLGYIPTDAAGLQKNVYRDVCAGYR
ncbi:hypothetical protein ACHAP5_010363 [Fusarium lateritium]